MVFSDLGATVIAIGDDPDGLNINDGCGSTHPGLLQARVTKEKADIGLAFDGDADRLIAVDEMGQIIDGDKILCICAKMMRDTGFLYGDLVTATVMSNLGFHKYLEKLDIKRDVTKVGDRYVLEQMLKSGCLLGGEQSGHLIFLNYTTTGDGILSALQFMKAIDLDGRKAREIGDEITLYPQVLKNAAIKDENKKKYEKDPEIMAEITRLEDLMAGEGRVLIRPSGTEPLVRVMIEGKNLEEITKLAEGLARLVTKRFG
jgi:phosphoglucosamine mutase